MADTRCWSKEMVREFIAIYKQCPSLWKVKSSVYMNKNLKSDAYGKLISLCKRVFPEADRDFVMKKIQSLRGAFRKEMRKVKASRRSGAASDDVYIPNLWYFDLLMFTMEQEEPGESISNIDEDESEVYPEPSLPEIEDEESQHAQINSVEGCSLQPLNTPRSQTPVRKKRRPTVADESLKVMRLCQETLNKTGEFDGAGMNVAQKLGKMDPIQAIYAEALIHNVLKEGLLGNLGPNSHFVSNIVQADERERVLEVGVPVPW